MHFFRAEQVGICHFYKVHGGINHYIFEYQAFLRNVLMALKLLFIPSVNVRAI